jgi:pimeloyl-ACP methyl ester carboxylesterase
LLLNKKSIDISCPVHLIHGMKDIDVPYSISERAAATIIANEIILKLIKGANHSLSRQEDLIVICNSIEEILSLY